MPPLLAFFSFLEEQQNQDQGRLHFSQEEQPLCLAAMDASALPPKTIWAGPPSEIRAAIRAYLLTRWGCPTTSYSGEEEMVLAVPVAQTGEIQRLLAALEQFYQFARERRYYWYDANPVAAFRLPLRSRLLHAILLLRCAWRAQPAPNQSRAEEGAKEAPLQRRHLAAPRLRVAKGMQGRIERATPVPASNAQRM